MENTDPNFNIRAMSIRGRKFSKTNSTRPKKGGGKKARRQRDQKKRLVALGMDEEEVRKLNPREVLTLLQRPLKVAKAAEGKKAEAGE